MSYETKKVPVMVTKTGTNYRPVTGTYEQNANNSASHSTLTKQTAADEVTTIHVATDDGDGSLYGTLGFVGYVAKSVTLKALADFSESSYESNSEDANSFESLNATGDASAATLPGLGVVTPAASAGGGGSATSKGGEYGSESFTETMSGSLLVKYKTGIVTPTSASETYTPPALTIDLAPRTKDYIVPGSVRFTWMGTVYEDFEGTLYYGRSEINPGTPCGVVHYANGTVLLSDYVVSGAASAFTLNSLWTSKPTPPTSSIVFNVALAPLKPAGLIFSCTDIAGTQIIGSAGLNGKITGDHIRGVVDFESGLCEIQFGDYVLDSALTATDKAEWWYDANAVMIDGTFAGKIWRPWPVIAATLRYNAVSYTYLPLDANILGIDPVRLPSDGRVPIFRAGGFAVLGHTESTTQTVANAQTIDCGRVRLSRVRVIGQNGIVINTGYSANLDAGTVTFSDVTGYSQPVTIEHRVEDMAMVSDVQINGAVKLTRQLTHDYPLGSVLSSALIAADLFSRVPLVFDQATWNGSYSDLVSGSAATGTFNNAQYPITVTNRGAVTERWVVRFTNSNSFEVIGEHVGLIATGNTATNCAPLNPATAVPYFTLPALGWGGGWATGNVLRFNTIGAQFPVWVIRTVQQGPETVTDDSFTLLIRGDVDRA